MNAQQIKTIRIIIFLFLAYTFFQYLLEQFQGMNGHILILPLIAIAWYINQKYALEYTLSFQLALFPIAVDVLFFDYLLPHLPTFLRLFPYRTLLFSSIYLLFIGCILHFKWLKMATAIFFIGVIFTFQTMPYSLWKAYQYDAHVQAFRSPIIDQLKHWKEDKKDIYLICLDGYPDLNQQKNHWKSQINNILKGHHFIQRPIKAQIAYTPCSIRQYLSLEYCPQEFTALNSALLKNHITNYLHQIFPKNWQIGLHSILFEPSSASIFFAVFPKPRVNRIVEKSFQNLFPAENVIGSPSYFAHYHQQLFQQVHSGKQHLEFLHFLSFHHVTNHDTVYQHQINEADLYAKKMIQRLEEKDPQAHVIVFSDHGERSQKELDPLKNIFYLKD